MALCPEDAMKNSDLEVNAFHFSNAIGACDRRDPSIKPGVDLLRQESVPSAVACRCGMWQDGVGLLEKMVGMNAEPDVVHPSNSA